MQTRMLFRDLNRRAFALVLVGGVLMAGLGFVTAGRLSLRSASAAGSGMATPGLSRLALGNAASVGTANLPRYGYVLLSPGEVGYIAQIKAASPGTKVLMYQSASEAVDYCSASDMVHCASAVSYQQALAHDQANPSDPWLLYSSAGVAQTMPSYPDSYLMNVGSASLQRQWASLVVSKAKSLGFDGVYIDSVLGMIYASSALYPTASAWETAMRSWVAYVGPSLKSQGLYVLTNTFKGGDNDGSLDIAWWTSLAPYVSGLQSEYFEEGPDAATRFDTNPCCWTGHWLNWMKLADAAQQNGADFFTVDKGTATNTSLMTYLRGTYLLVWDGSGGGFAYEHEPADSLDPWNPAWTTDIGTPLGARYQVGAAWRRDYSAGTVIVDPDPVNAQTVSLGATYTTLAGQNVTSITVQPDSAAILTTTTTTPPPRRPRPPPRPPRQRRPRRPRRPRRRPRTRPCRRSRARRSRGRT